MGFYFWLGRTFLPPQKDVVPRATPWAWCAIFFSLCAVFVSLWGDSWYLALLRGLIVLAAIGCIGVALTYKWGRERIIFEAVRVFKESLAADPNLIPRFVRAWRTDPNATDWFCEEKPDWAFLAHLGEESCNLRDIILGPFAAEYSRSLAPNTPSIHSPTQETVQSILQRVPVPVELPGDQRFHNVPRYISLMFGSLVKDEVDIAVVDRVQPVVRQYLRRAFCYPFLHRLKFIRQIGTLSFGLNLDAAHRRLSHTCGTLEAALVLFDALRQPVSKNGCAPALDGEQQDAVALAALLHDAFQGPFGHSLEMLRSLVLPDSSKSRFRLDHLLLHNALEDYSSGAKSLSAQTIEVLLEVVPIASDKDKTGILRLLDFIFSRDGTAHSVPHNADICFLHEMLHGPAIDADRFDYVRRDALHLANLPKGHARWLSLIQKARLVREPEASGNGGSLGRLRIAFAEADMGLVKTFLEFRRNLYEQVYETPEKLAADDMFCHLIYDCVEEAWTGDATADRSLRADVYSALMQLTDHELLHFLRDIQLGIRNPVRRGYLETRLADVLHDRPFVPLFALARVPGRPGVWGIADLGKKRMRGCADTGSTEDIPHPISNPQDLTALPLKSQAMKNLRQCVVIRLANAFVGRVEMERDLWQNMLQADSKLRKHWRQALALRLDKEVSSDDFDYLNRHIPQVFLTVPRFVNQEGERPEILQPTEDQVDPDITHDFRTGEPIVLYYDGKGRPFSKAQNLRNERRRLRLVVSVAPELRDFPGIFEIVKDSVLEMLPRVRTPES